MRESKTYSRKGIPDSLSDETSFGSFGDKEERLEFGLKRSDDVQELCEMVWKDKARTAEVDSMVRGREMVVVKEIAGG